MVSESLYIILTVTCRWNSCSFRAGTLPLHHPNSVSAGSWLEI